MVSTYALEIGQKNNEMECSNMVVESKIGRMTREEALANAKKQADGGIGYEEFVTMAFDLIDTYIVNDKALFEDVVEMLGDMLPDGTSSREIRDAITPNDISEVLDEMYDVESEEVFRLSERIEKDLKLGVSSD